MSIPIHNASAVMTDEFPFRIYKRQGEYRWSMHSHDFIQMWYIVQGDFIHYFGEDQYKLSKGSIFVLPPYAVHGVRAEGPECQLFGVEFTEKLLQGDGGSQIGHPLMEMGYIQPFIVSSEDIQPSFPLAGSVSRVLEELFEETYVEFLEKPPYHELLIKANLMKILALITREYAKGINEDHRKTAQRHRESIAMAIEYLEEHFAERITLDSLCKYTFMSSSHFSYAFRQVTGCTPIEYLTRLRLRHARKMLTETDRPISIIAADTGFQNSSSLDRAFKKEVGITPLQYRKEKNMW